MLRTVLPVQVLPVQVLPVQVSLMPFALILMGINLIFVVHAVRTGRASPWVFILLFIPGLGMLAYIVAELVPEWLGTYKASQLRKQIGVRLDPEKRYRALHDQLAVADTMANRQALAEEAMNIGRYEEALTIYERILVDPRGEEPVFVMGKAQALAKLNRPQAALQTLDQLKAIWPEYQSQAGHLLYARCLEALGENEAALSEYYALSNYYAGYEPKYRQAELLMRLGRNQEAKAVAQDLVRTWRLSPDHVKRKQKEWKIAADKLLAS